MAANFSRRLLSFSLACFFFLVCGCGWVCARARASPGAVLPHGIIWYQCGHNSGEKNFLKLVALQQKVVWHIFGKRYWWLGLSSWQCYLATLRVCVCGCGWMRGRSRRRRRKGTADTNTNITHPPRRTIDPHFPPYKGVLAISPSPFNSFKNPLFYSFHLLSPVGWTKKDFCTSFLFLFSYGRKCPPLIFFLCFNGVGEDPTSLITRFSQLSSFPFS